MVITIPPTNLFQVEETLYKLHRSLLERHSPVFQELFTVPQPEGSTEGLADDNPIVLPGIQAVNFTRLLWLLYPPCVVSLSQPLHVTDLLRFQDARSLPDQLC